MATHPRRLLLAFFGQAGAAQSVGERYAALFMTAPRRCTPRRGAHGVIARRRCAAAAGARADLVVQPERQRDAFARLVNLQDLDADDVARLHNLAGILDEVL